MKKYISFMMMAAMMAVTVPMLTACGSDDDEEDGNGTEWVSPNANTLGTHRIDIIVTGNTSGWGMSAGFTGTPENADVYTGAKLFENGIRLEKDSPAWLCGELRNYSISTDNKCIGLWLALTITKETNAPLEPMTVTLMGYVNGKLMQQKTYTVNNESGLTTHINFGSEKDVFDVKEFG